MDFISMNSIRTNFDAAMMRAGYVRTKIMCDHWGITQDQLNYCFRKGYVCDCFMVNGVKYMSVASNKPEGFFK